jgi:hypothetical protein
MKDLVLNEDPDQRIEVEQNKFIRDKNNWTIRTETMSKLYRQVYDKRILLVILKHYLLDFELIRFIVVI